MGLDITAYKNLKKVEKPQLDKDGYPVNWESEWLPGASMARYVYRLEKGV